MQPVIASDPVGSTPVVHRLSAFYRGVLRVVNAAPDLAIAGGFLTVWISPFAFGAKSVEHYLLIILLEFIVIHSAAFMGTAAAAAPTPGKRVLAVLGFGLFYSLFAGGFAAGFHTWWPFVAFWGLTLNRLIGFVIGGPISGIQQEAMKKSWGISATFYMIGCFLTVFAFVPRLGLTRQVVASLHLTQGGLWIDEPQRAIAFGFLYFTAQALYELFGSASRPGVS